MPIFSKRFVLLLLLASSVGEVTAAPKASSSVGEEEKKPKTYTRSQLVAHCGGDEQKAIRMLCLGQAGPWPCLMKQEKDPKTGEHMYILDVDRPRHQDVIRRLSGLPPLPAVEAQQHATPAEPDAMNQGHPELSQWLAQGWEAARASAQPAPAVDGETVQESNRSRSPRACSSHPRSDSE